MRNEEPDTVCYPGNLALFIEKALELDFDRYSELLAYMPELDRESRFIELLEIYKNSE